VEQSADDSQKFQRLVKLQICFEVSLVYLTIFSRLHQQLRSATAPLNRFYVLWHHRNYRFIIIIIIVNIEHRDGDEFQSDGVGMELQPVGMGLKLMRLRFACDL